MRHLLDTNIALRSLNSSLSSYELVVSVLERLRSEGHELCLVPQVLYEYWAVVTRPAIHNGFGLSTTQALDDLEELKASFTLLRDERAVLNEWERLVAESKVQGRSTHDARLVAAMRRHAIAHIVTFNVRDFSRYPGVIVVEPRLPTH